MDRIGRGVIAGFLATLILSAAVDPMTTVARTADVLSTTFGWMLHFVVGSLVWGASFALLERRLFGPLWLRGLVFGFLAWLVVMLTVMPLTRGDWFGLALGVATPVTMLAIHLIYGAMLGAFYSLLDPEAPEHERRPLGRPPVHRPRLHSAHR